VRNVRVARQTALECFCQAAEPVGALASPGMARTEPQTWGWLARSVYIHCTSGLFSLGCDHKFGFANFHAF